MKDTDEADMANPRGEDVKFTHIKETTWKTVRQFGIIVKWPLKSREK
jgi:hypothetical protein